MFGGNNSSLGRVGYNTQMVGYPETGGYQSMTDFSQNQNLGTIQTPGQGFLGGMSGTGGQGIGHLIGSVVGQGPGQTLADSLGDYPHLQAAVKLLTPQGGGMSGAPGHHVSIAQHGQAGQHATSISKLIDTALSYFTYGAVGSKSPTGSQSVNVIG